MKKMNTHITRFTSISRILRTLRMVLAVLLIIPVSSCTDFLEVSHPATRITSGIVFENDDTALAATLGMYDLMTRLNSFSASGSPSSVSTLTGFLSDEFINYSPLNTEFADNNLSPSNPQLFTLWSSAYSTIYAANAVLEGLASAKGVSQGKQQQFEGEAKFVRAFCHFYLMNLFGDIPLVTKTDYRVNASIARSSVTLAYDQIKMDLIEAQKLLSNAYPGVDRARPNKGCATALLARVYLYNGEWALAEAEASKVIEDPSYQLENELSNVFKVSSKEAIWQLASTGDYYDTYEGLYYILYYAPENQSISDELISSFEEGDNRLTNWISTYEEEGAAFHFPYKYKVDYNSSAHVEHSMVLRLAEQFLIRSEARAMQNKLTGIAGAEGDINQVRQRAGLPPADVSSQQEYLTLLAQERRVELFSEWGHRWFDLKRTGKADEQLSPLKPDWSSSDMLLPIPEIEMRNNPSLTPQNPGY
jgi:starch-binding outer membrane protein, SusD/RagB family